MNIKIVSKKFELTNPIREKIENTFSHLEKYLAEDTDVQVRLDVTKRSQRVEVTVFTKGGIILRAEDSQDNIYNAVDTTYDKLYKQIRKLKTQLMKKNKSNESIRFNNIEEYHDKSENENKIVKVKKFNLDKPLTPEYAILQMDLLGHDFFVFKNVETDEINMVYKRHDGYGLIEQM